jgi:thiol:disulfide interchange protein DsbD
MCGLFNIQLPQFVYRINPRHDSVAGSFGFGVMTAVLSTPCTAPFMGSAAAWAAGQHPATTLTTFAAIGSGMALPYLLLSIWPALVDRMPRTGPANVLIKQVMGLLLLAAAAYFIGVGLSGWWVDPPAPPSVAYWWPVMGLIAAAGVWMGIATWRITSSAAKRGVFVTLGVVMLAASVYGAVRLTDPGPIAWAYYTAQRFDGALRDGNVVVMDFTAEWCLNCKWLERNVLDDPRVTGALRGENVVPMKVDLTGNNEEGNRKLKEVGRLTIPLLVIFAPDGREVFKSDFYTADQVVRAIDAADSGR